MLIKTVSDSTLTDQDRLKTMESAIADLRIEGFNFSKENLDILREVALGKKTTEDVIAEVKKKFDELRITNPEKFVCEGKIKND